MKRFYNQLSSLSCGDRIVVPKSLWGIIQHHAIYLGFFNSQYWVIENKEGYGVRIVSADVFFTGVNQITRIEYFQPTNDYSRENLYVFANSKVGKAYNLLNYNCESFANEVQHRKAKSPQIINTGLLLGAAGVLFLLNNNKKQ